MKNSFQESNGVENPSSGSSHDDDDWEDVMKKNDVQESNGVENPSSGSSLTVRSRTTASAASRRSNLEVILE